MKNTKQTLLSISISLASLLLASTTSFANVNYKENYKGEAPCPPVLTLKGGLYVGLQGGYDMYRIASEIFDADLDDTFSLDPVVFAGGAVGGAFIGYGRYFDSLYPGLYLGLEVFGNWSGAKTDLELTIDEDGTGTDLNRLEADYRVKTNFGIDVIPGIKLNPATLFYVKLGYNWAIFDIDELPNSFINSFDFNSDPIGGFHFGVGIESTFWENWSVRAEYTHTWFDDVGVEIRDLEDEVVFHSKFFPSGNQFLLSALYHFNI